LYKEQYFVEPLFTRLLQPLWNRARDVEKMLREAFADHDLERVVIVNPDRAVDARVRALTHYRGGLVTFDDLASYVRALGATTLPEDLWPPRRPAPT